MRGRSEGKGSGGVLLCTKATNRGVESHDVYENLWIMSKYTNTLGSYSFSELVHKYIHPIEKGKRSVFVPAFSTVSDVGAALNSDYHRAFLA